MQNPGQPGFWVGGPPHGDAGFAHGHGGRGDRATTASSSQPWAVSWLCGAWLRPWRQFSCPFKRAEAAGGTVTSNKIPLFVCIWFADGTPKATRHDGTLSYAHCGCRNRPWHLHTHACLKANQRVGAGAWVASAAESCCLPYTLAVLCAGSTREEHFEKSLRERVTHRPPTRLVFRCSRYHVEPMGASRCKGADDRVLRVHSHCSRSGVGPSALARPRLRH